VSDTAHLSGVARSDVLLQTSAATLMGGALRPSTTVKKSISPNSSWLAGGGEHLQQAAEDLGERAARQGPGLETHRGRTFLMT